MEDILYTNIYFISNENKVNVIKYNHPTNLQLLYNREQDEYMWYLYSKENGENLYKSLDKILKELQKDSKEIQGNESEEIYADYTFKDDEIESKLEVTEGEMPIISRFDKTFIKVKLDESNTTEIDFEGNDKDLKQNLVKTVQDYKTKEETVTEKIKTEIKEQDTKLENKQEEIKQLEEKKRQDEEAARKAAEEEAARKAAEEAEKANTAQAGKYTLQDRGRDGSLTISNVTENSLKFDINVVNLSGANHLGELEGTATKSSDKYVYTNSEYGQTYKFYMEIKGDSIEVTTSKLMKGDGFDPFCGANAYFDGTYSK